VLLPPARTKPESWEWSIVDDSSVSDKNKKPGTRGAKKIR
jgi:hypothetical protein